MITSINVLEDGPRNFVVQLTGDIGTNEAETDALKVDVSLLSPNPQGEACTNVSIQKIDSNTTGTEVQLRWEGSGNPLAAVIPSDFSGRHDYMSIGGIVNKAAGRTGNILLSTISRVYPSTDTQYDITLWLKKRYN
jgi:hypothetical protein